LDFFKIKLNLIKTIMCFRNYPTNITETKPFKKMDEIKQDMNLLSDISNINKQNQNIKNENSPKFTNKDSIQSLSTSSSFKEL